MLATTSVCVAPQLFSCSSLAPATCSAAAAAVKRKRQNAQLGGEPDSRQPADFALLAARLLHAILKFRARFALHFALLATSTEVPETHSGADLQMDCEWNQKSDTTAPVS